MGKVNFYVLWSLQEAPRQFISKSNRMCYQVQLPLPLPKQLVVLSIGDWKALPRVTTISVDVVVSPDLEPQTIGSLSPQSRCLIWDGAWRVDLLTETKEQVRRGVNAKILLTVSGEVISSFINSTPKRSMKRPRPDWQPSEQVNRSASEDSRAHSDISEVKGSRMEMDDSTQPKEMQIWPVEKTPRRSVIEKLTWHTEEVGSAWDFFQTSSPKIMRRSQSVEKATTWLKTCRAVRPSKRWCHAMCLSDPETAVVIGGEVIQQAVCKDLLWKLEIDSNFWFPMDSFGTESMPPCSQGLSATFDPVSKLIYVYGGLKEEQHYSDIHILDTKTWKWRHVTAKGSVPGLAYHTATVFKKELFVFGGIKQTSCPAGKACSNALYIFNPEFQLWYQPIVEGDKPLPRFGHSTVLLSDKLVIFGGRTTATYLNDIHILDLGFMEFTTMKFKNMPPLPRGYHAAVPLADSRMLISGGCSAVGALNDIHILNLDTCFWSSVTCTELGSRPRAGHSMLCLSGPHTRALPEEERPGVTCYTLLVFGGADCTGTFYNDTVKCTVDLPMEESGESLKHDRGKIAVRC